MLDGGLERAALEGRARAGRDLVAGVSASAEALRLRRTTLIEKMKKFGIRRGVAV